MAERPELDSLVHAVLSSGKYATIHPGFVHRVATQEMDKGRKRKETLKAVKNKLHQVCGAYLGNKMDHQRWLVELQEAAASSPEALKDACLDIMASHASTRERLPILDEFYSAIFAELPPIRSVLDLACGLNPLAIPWMPLAPNAAYKACDIFGEMTTFLDEFLALMPLNGEAWTCDLLGDPPAHKVDLALLLKTLPVLEQVEKGAGAQLLKTVKADYLLVSYPVSSLGGREKGMVEHYEGEFHDLINAWGWEFKRFEFATELAFIVKKDLTAVDFKARGQNQKRP